MRTLGDITTRYAKLTPDKEALVFEDTRLTWKMFHERANRLANWLVSKGGKKGETVSALAQNCNQYYELYFAAFKTGMIMAPVNYRLSPGEMIYLLNHSDARILFVGGEYFDFVAEHIDEMEHVETLVSFDGPTPGMEDYEIILAVSSPRDPDVDIDESDVALISYTGGTTGLPKGAMLTHRNLITTLRTIALMGSLTSDYITLQVLPPFHLTIWQTLMVLYVGGTSVLNKKVDLPHILGLFGKEKITHINLVPVLLNWMMKVPDLDKYDFSTLEYITYGGAPIPEAVLEECIRRLTPNFAQGYGLTESTMLATALTSEYHVISDDPVAKKRLQSAGREILHADVRVVDEDGVELPPGQIGEIIIRGPNVMKGYWKDPELTSERIRGEWLYSNDMGYFDQDWFLYIVDRKADMIITGGENVYPAEVENVIYQLPAVLEAAVVSAPDERWGETVAASIVLRKGSELSEEELIRFCKDRLAGYKCPRIVRFVPTLPKSPIDKIVRKEVREEYWKGHERRVQ